MRKRIRACEECHRLKIKCDVDVAPPCERCSRFGLDCVPAAPRLQRDRISELEAQLQELKNTLRAQGSSSGNCLTPSGSSASSQGDHNIAVLTFLDARVGVSTQRHLLEYFKQRSGSSWPIVDIHADLSTLRAKSPSLLLAIIACFVTQEGQSTEVLVHDEILRETMHVLGEELIPKGRRSLEMVQTLLVTAFWNKPARGGSYLSCYQMIQLAADMAIDLGLAGPAWQPSPAALFSRHDDPTTPQARSTWLACYIALSLSSISIRRPNPVPWNDHHQECVNVLERRGEPADLLLCQMTRITHLGQEICTALSLHQITVFVDGNASSTHATMSLLAAKADEWASQVPPSLASSQILRVLFHVTMIHIYEPILHTPTNKASFAAPFIPIRLPIKDFPRPAQPSASLPHALSTIVTHCHAVISTAAAMDPELVLSLPSFCFAPAVLYALFVLVSTLVACTDPTNTYGQCTGREVFRVEEFGTKLRDLTGRMRALDPSMSCWTTRM